MNITVNTFPPQIKHYFNFFIKKDSILIERVDANDGWNFDLVLDIHNSVTKETIRINTGQSINYKYKCIHMNTGLITDSQPQLLERYTNIENEVFPSKNKGVLINSINLKPEDIKLSKNDNVVLTSSVIYVNKNIKLFGQSRSVIPPLERYKQTLLTLKTIKKQIPNSKVVLLEKSIKMPQHQIDELLLYCDYLILYKDDYDCIYNCHIQNLTKGLGELYVTNHFLKIIKNHEFARMIKVNARNVLTSEFPIDFYVQSKIPVFSYTKGTSFIGIVCYTNSYSIPKEYIQLYSAFLDVWLNGSKKNLDLEYIHTRFAESLSEFKLIPSLGILCKAGFTGEIYKI
jgi:hypothetical protein